MCYLPAQKENDMSEIHNQREIELLEAQLRECRAENAKLRAEMAAKLSALMDTHDDMADDLENMRQALLDIVAVIGLVGTNCGGRVMKIAKFALGGEND